MQRDRYGLVGHPVAHSWSPFIHGLFARDLQQAMVYGLYDLLPEELAAGVRDFFAHGGRGLNVTVPHKVAAVALATELTPRARQAGAVNTLAARTDSGVLGDNTDGAGLVADLRDNLRVDIARLRVLILGSGGAARGVVGPLIGLSPGEIVIANRTPDRAQALASAWADLGAVRGSDLPSLEGERFDLVINATSASLSSELPGVSPRIIAAAAVCYDMSYGKSETPFVRWARELGCPRAVTGWGMLVEQAAESFRVWRGVRPRTAPVLAALKARAGAAA